MAEFDGGNCMHFQYNDCSYIDNQSGGIVFRKTCSSDCREYQISKVNEAKGSCEIIALTNVFKHTSESCLSLCLDTDGCRGSIFWESTGSCELYRCDSITTNNGTRFTKRKCLGQLPSTVQKDTMKHGTVSLRKSTTTTYQFFASAFRTYTSLHGKTETTDEMSSRSRSTKQILPITAVTNNSNPTVRTEPLATTAKTRVATFTFYTSIATEAIMRTSSSVMPRSTLNASAYAQSCSSRFIARSSTLLAGSVAGGFVTAGMLSGFACYFANKGTKIIPRV